MQTLIRFSILALLLTLAGSASGDTETLRPNAVGTTTQWTKSTGTYNYQCVDEVTVSDADYVSETSIGEVDIYRFDNPDSIAANATITNVRLYVRGKYVTAAGVSVPIINVSGTNRSPDAFGFEFTSSFVDYYYDWATNPDDASAWIESDLDSIQAGMACDLGTPRVSWVYLVVTYTNPATGLVGVRANNAAVGVRGCNDAASITVRGKQ